MNAFEIPGLRYSLPAGGAVARHRFVSVNADGNGVQAVTTTQIVGASLNAVETDKGVTAAQQVVEVADGIVIVEAGGEVAAGIVVYADANGKAVATGTIVAGIAITGAGADKDLLTVKM